MSNKYEDFFYQIRSLVQLFCDIMATFGVYRFAQRLSVGTKSLSDQ